MTKVPDLNRINITRAAVRLERVCLVAHCLLWVLQQVTLKVKMCCSKCEEIVIEEIGEVPGG